MDYRREIKKMLKIADANKLKVIYKFIKNYLKLWAD